MENLQSFSSVSLNKIEQKPFLNELTIDINFMRRDLYASITKLAYEEKNALYDNFNIIATDYIAWSSFVLLPLLESVNKPRIIDKLLDNSKGYSYLSSIFELREEKRLVCSIMIEMLTDRFLLEDLLIKELTN